MVNFSDVNKGYNSLASAASVVNLLNNGSFSAYPYEAEPVEDRSKNRRNYERTYTPTSTEEEDVKNFDIIDARLYRETRPFSFVSPKAAGTENILGYWDCYGGAAIDVAPIDSSGFVLTSRDGGNLIKITLPSTGSSFLEQTIEDIEGLFDSEVTVAFSGQKITASTKVTMSVIADGSELIAIQSNSQLFGPYRRLTGTVKLPSRFATLAVRIKIEGVPSSAVGLSGCSLVKGAQTRVPYTPSIPDLVLPSGMVIIVLGAACPPGFAQPAAYENRLALVSGSKPVVSYLPNTGMSTTGPEVLSKGGNDEHDHSDLASAPIDGLGEADANTHATVDILPDSARAYVHGVPFGDPNIFPSPGQFPNEKPAETLGILHTHRLSSLMTAIPPSFGVRFCRKI